MAKTLICVKIDFILIPCGILLIHRVQEAMKRGWKRETMPKMEKRTNKISKAALSKNYQCE